MISRKPRWVQRHQARLTLWTWAQWERWTTWNGREDWRARAMRKAEGWGLLFVGALTLGVALIVILFLVANYSTLNGTTLIIGLILWGIMAIHGCFNGKSLIKNLGQADGPHALRDEVDRVAHKRIRALAGHLLADSLSSLEWRMTKIWATRWNPACKSEAQSVLDRMLPVDATPPTKERL